MYIICQNAQFSTIGFTQCEYTYTARASGIVHHDQTVPRRKKYQILTYLLYVNIRKLFHLAIELPLLYVQDNYI